MSRFLITGSADGLGQMAAPLLPGLRHRVGLHARDARRGVDAIAGALGADGVLVGDLSRIDEMRSFALQRTRWALSMRSSGMRPSATANRNASSPRTVCRTCSRSTLAPSVPTASMHPPKRPVYLSSGLQRSGDASLRDLTWSERAWNGTRAYSDSKLHDAILAFAVAQHWPEVQSNAVEPG